ncbi:MAG TPA: hypothetical protein VGD00_06070 [Solirubrobacteraceae bacterium]
MRRRRQAIENCELCFVDAPAWTARAYRRWYVGLTPPGEYLGVVCPGCLADEDLALVLLQAEVQEVQAKVKR